MELKIGELYRHYPFGKKQFLNKTIEERKYTLVGNKMDGSGLGYRAKQLLCNEECIPIVLYLGTKKVAHQECHIFLNGEITYLLQVGIYLECNDELELL